MRVLLTGGTGLIGRALTRVLAERYNEVVILTRGSESSRGPIRYARWDGKAIPPELNPNEYQAVIHLAGASIAGRRWSSAYQEILWQSRIDSTEAVVTWLKKARKPPRFISTSAVGYYGHSLSTEVCTEESPPGKDFLAGLAIAWEAAAQKAPNPPFIARLGIVLTREGGAFPKLLQGFRLGIGTYFWPGDQGFSWIHIQDAVRALIWALDHPWAVGPHNVCSPHPLGALQLARAIAKYKRAQILLPIPRGPLYWFYGDLADTLHKGQYAYPEKLSLAGFSFAFPTIDEALQDLLRR